MKKGPIDKAPTGSFRAGRNQLWQIVTTPEGQEGGFRPSEKNNRTKEKKKVRSDIQKNLGQASAFMECRVGASLFPFASLWKSPFFRISSS